MPRFLASTAMRRTDQRACPFGGSLHTMAMMALSSLWSSNRGGMGRGSSLRAASKPLFRYRHPTRRTSRGYVPTARPAAVRFQPASSSSRMRMRRQSRSRRAPSLFTSSRLLRSALVSFNPGNRVPDVRSVSLIHRRRSNYPTGRQVRSARRGRGTSGDCTPSTDDIILTRRLKEAGELLGIPLLDHVIVTDCM